MFGLGKKEDPEAKAQREAAEAQARKTVCDILHAMREASPEVAEKLAEQLKEFCRGDKLLAMDIKQKANKKARELECDANMRAGDHRLHEASQLAAEEKLKERTMKLGEARQYYSKACRLGATDSWRHAFQRTSETIMLTGGVQHKGPTRAKPLDIAPKTPNRAKPVDSTPKPPNRAKG